MRVLFVLTNGKIDYYVEDLPNRQELEKTLGKFKAIISKSLYNV